VVHVDEPDQATEQRDQHDFDEAVDRDLKHVLEILAAVGVVAAIVMSTIALVKSSQGHGTTTVTVQAPQTASRAAAPVAPAATLDVKIVGGSKLGPDGKKHDAYSVTNFPVKVGQSLKLRIDNTDDVPHNIVSPAVNVNILVKPGVHTYTLAVNTAGRFQWFCTIPCDTDANGWAMQHAGFMSGYITAT
jgi:hypothetical protein